jgi:hypothetical protein
MYYYFSVPYRTQLDLEVVVNKNENYDYLSSKTYYETFQIAKDEDSYTPSYKDMDLSDGTVKNKLMVYVGTKETAKITLEAGNYYIVQERETPRSDFSLKLSEGKLKANTIKFEKRNTLVVAHRGLSGIERENTNSAFVAAGNRSYYGIETDIHKTADGRFSSLFKGSFCLLGESGESGRIADSDLRQHLAVQGDIRLLQTVHKGGIVHAVQLSSGIDTSDPQAAEIALALAAANISILTGLHNRLFSGLKQLGLGTEVTLSQLQNFLSSFARHHCAFNTSHSLFPPSTAIICRESTA